MLNKIRKKALLFIPIFTCISLSLLAADKKPRITEFKYGGYVFTASYALHSSIEPSDLQVDMIAEFNMRPSQCIKYIWLPQMRFLELRFLQDGEIKKVDVSRVYDEKRNVIGCKVKKLDAHETIWDQAIEKIAENLGSQCYGVNPQQKSLSNKKLRDPTLSISVQPLKNHKLHTVYDLNIHPHTLNLIPLNVEIDIQEEPYNGKKQIIASAHFCDRNEKDANRNEESILKFIQTKSGLKEISREKVKSSIVWYPGIQKIVRKSIARYKRFKHRHHNVIKSAPLNKLRSPNRYPNLKSANPTQTGIIPIGVPCSLKK